MPFTILECRDSDYEAVAAIQAAIDHTPRSAAELRNQDLEYRQVPSLTIVRLVAEDEGGQIAGYCVGSFFAEQPDRGWYNRVLVHPGRRHEGAGRQLADALERFCRERGARKLSASIMSGDAESEAWALRRGFSVKRERTESILDLSTWDSAMFAGALERPGAAGLRFLTMNQVPESMLEEQYAIDVETGHDHPEYSGRDLPYEDWLRAQRVDQRPKFYAFAMDGDRVAGYSFIYLPDQPGGEAYTEYTCVRRQYRGLGVALATKILTIEVAKQAGAARMRTNNNPENLPMLKVNEKLGYQMLPAPKMVEKVLEP